MIRELRPFMSSSNLGGHSSGVSRGRSAAALTATIDVPRIGLEGASPALAFSVATRTAQTHHATVPEAHPPEACPPATTRATSEPTRPEAVQRRPQIH